MVIGLQFPDCFLVELEEVRRKFVHYSGEKRELGGQTEVKRCRWCERQRANAGGCRSHAHTRGEGGT